MSTPEELVVEERPVATYAQPLSRLQVSWGSILAGAVAIVAVFLLLWTLSLAFILSATSATVSGMKAALIAALVTSIISTLAGAFVGGMVAGYLPGNPRRIISVAHGFLAWSAAFIFSALLHLALLSGVTRATTDALVTTASAAVQSAGAAVGGAAGAPAGLEQKATSVLQTLGYTQAEAAAIVTDARNDLRQVLRGEGPQAQKVEAGAQQAAAQARGALDTLINWGAGYVWLWWGTWIVAGVLAVAGAAWVVNRTKRVPEREREIGIGSEPLHVTTLRAARTVS